MRLAGTRLAHHPSRAGLTRDSKAGPVWTGDVRLNEQWLTQPLQWKRPRPIFVCAHGDLFAEGVPDEWIDRVFAVMALAPQHVFQVLTKRPERMRNYMNARRQESARRGSLALASMGLMYSGPPVRVSDPLDNVWLGVSVEDQRRADERIPDLLATPAAVRWISAEPLLGPLDLYNGDPDPRLGGHKATRCYLGEWWELGDNPKGPPRQGVDWIVVGGESGPGARVWDGFEAAARSIRDQCRAAGVPFFMKQMQGARKSAMPPIPDDLMVREFPR